MPDDIIDDIVNDALGLVPEPTGPSVIGTQTRDGLVIFDPPAEDIALDSAYAAEEKIRPRAPGILQLQLDGDVDLPYYQVFWVEDRRGKIENCWKEFDAYAPFQQFMRAMLHRDEFAIEQAIALLHNFRLVNVDLKTRGSASVRGFDKVGSFI